MDTRMNRKNMMRKHTRSITRPINIHSPFSWKKAHTNYLNMRKHMLRSSIHFTTLRLLGFTVASLSSSGDNFLAPAIPYLLQKLSSVSTARSLVTATEEGQPLRAVLHCVSPDPV